MALAATRRPGRCGRYPVCLAAVPAPDNLACHGFIIPLQYARPVLAADGQHITGQGRP